MIESPVILVIEDDPAVRTGIVDTLEYGGYRYFGSRQRP